MLKNKKQKPKKLNFDLYKQKSQLKMDDKPMYENSNYKTYKT